MITFFVFDAGSAPTNLGKLQSAMCAHLAVISEPLRVYFNGDASVRALSELQVPLSDPAVYGLSAWRQDAPGLVPSLSSSAHVNGCSAAFGSEDEGAERVMVHVYRILAIVLAARFDAVGRAALAHASAADEGATGTFRNPGTKGVARMLGKMQAADDHRYLARPRPAANLDVLRAALVLSTPSALTAAVLFVEGHNDVHHIVRVKNGYADQKQPCASKMQSPK